MFLWLGEQLFGVYGPFRLFTSYLFLAGVGTALSALLTWWLLPHLWHLLPKDQGRAFAVGAAQSEGKPVGAGIIFIPIFIIAGILFVPLHPRYLETLGCMFLAMLVGFLDDRSGGWSEYRMGAADLGISALAAMVMCQGQPFELWLPLLKSTVLVSPWIFVPVASVLLWLAINATNCTDGVDG
ncbi:MAG: phospho-N-acetylmuramoyl-pentapeptide-transferase, partial [Candidatus Latescibacteria bacterium]|nr:phospho-N-acetylmuramoyl-pentapeptide-transferase [Candidatus Latescibacterota bacterium]